MNIIPYVVYSPLCFYRGSLEWGYMTEREAYIALSFCPGVGPVKVTKGVAHYGSAVRAYLLLEECKQFRERFDPVSKEIELKKQGIGVLTRCDPDYPESLRPYVDRPVCLYTVGNTQWLMIPERKRVAIVGTRRPSMYGLQVTRRFGQELAEAGVTIVSGMALGVDTAAHQAAIERNGTTIAVLGTAIDVIYPRTNYELYKAIERKSGVVISEYPPGTAIKKGTFAMRNRLISGLCAGTLVVEGYQDSGALITAGYAAEQGKEVYAPPVPITSSLSEAPLYLLRQGAKLVTEPNDILVDLGLSSSLEQERLAALDPFEKRVVQTLKEEATSADQVAIKMKESLQLVLQSLSMLELKGVVLRASDGNFCAR